MTRTAASAVGRHVRARAEWYWAPALYAAVVAFLYAPIWSGEQGFGWDTIETYWADLALLSDQLARGEAPLWNPYDRGGYPFHADPQPGIYYPIHWLFALIGAVTGGISWWHIQIKMLLHHVIAGAGMHLFARSRGLPRPAAVAGGVALVVCAPMMIHKASNILMPLAWAPLIWLAIDRLVARPDWRRGLLLAGAIYLAGSTGSPPGFFYTLLVGIAYGAYRGGASLVAAGRLGAGELAEQAKRLALSLAAAAAATLALHLIIVMPALELTEHSPRADRGMGYVLMGSMDAKEALIGLVYPYFGQSQVYCGIAAAVLAACGLALRPVRDRGAPIFLALTGALFFALSLGRGAPVLEWMATHVPGFDLFRIANRYKLPFMYLYAALVAYGAAALLEVGRTRWRALAAGAVGLAVALVVAAIAREFWEDLGDMDVPRWHAFAIAFGAASLAAAAAALRGRVAGACVLAIAVLIHWDVPHYREPFGPIMEPRLEADAADALDGLEGIGDRWRVYDEYVVEQRAGSRLGFRELRSYPSGDPLDLARYRNLRAYVKKDPEILTDYNVRYVLHGRHHRNGKRENAIARRPDHAAPGAFRPLGQGRFEAVDPAPLVRHYDRIALERDPGRVLDRVAGAREGGDRRAYAVVEPGDVPASERERLEALTGREPGGAGRASTELLDYGANRIRVRVDASGPGLVVLNEIEYPGWEVEVDGREAEGFRANYLLRAVLVDEGSHEIVWRYEPPRYGLWLILWLAGLGAVAIAVAARKRERPKR